MAVFGQTATYVDAKGQSTKVSFFISNATAAGALAAGTAAVDAISAITNCAFDGARGAYTSPPGAHTYGTDAQYETVEDKAVLTFRTASGAIHKYQVPAPIVGIFREDDETVKTPDAGGDAEQILMQTLVDAFVGDVCSRDGVLLAAYVGGTRLRRKNQRKFNIFTLNPDLNGPGL